MVDGVVRCSARGRRGASFRRRAMTHPPGIAGRTAGLAARIAAFVVDPPGVYLSIGMLLVALFAATTFVVSRFEHARSARADSLFAEGARAVEAYRVTEGIVSLRASLALNRRNPEYGLALADALLEAGRPREATSYLDAVLAERPTGGPANLVRARAARMLGDVDEAVLYYRRSADGTWPPGRRAERVAARFEVAEYLLGRGRLPDATIVLSELRVSAPEDIATRLRLSKLLLVAKQPGDAAVELRALTTSKPGEEAWALLAQAEFALGNDAAARTWGQRALRARPDDVAMAELVEVADGTLARDPTLPRLRNAERVRRARRLLVEVLDASSACTVGQELMPESIDRARSHARDFLRNRNAVDVDPVVDAVQLAEVLWATTVSVCSDTPGRYPTLNRLLSRLLAARPEGS